VGPAAAPAGSSSPPIMIGRLVRSDGGRVAPANPWGGVVDCCVDRFHSPVGNPFTSLSVQCACDAYASLMARLMCYYLASSAASATLSLQDLAAQVRDLPSACLPAESLFIQTLLRALATTHDVRLHDYALAYEPRRAMLWLVEAAIRSCEGASLRLLCWCRDDLDTDRSLIRRRPCHATVLVSAIHSLLAAGPSLEGSLVLRAGDWDVASIFSCHPPLVAAALATFTWPISDVDELDRLLADSHAAPNVLVACEFTGAISSQLRSQWGWDVLSVDSRAASVQGLHCVLDIRLVLRRRRWRAVFAFPPCTHQTLVDRHTRSYKELDGRAFWGIALVILLKNPPKNRFNARWRRRSRAPRL